MAAREPPHSPDAIAPAEAGDDGARADDIRPDEVRALAACADGGRPDDIGADKIDDEAAHGDHARWLHRLRNELNTANMACAAAQALLANGAIELAQENLRRAANAGARMAKVLDEAPTRR
ncbi:hypothetical protein [Lysobacter sp. 1R34A]|uniref:hypothetical protein n=1 Tax=Lysobacter sp. 1R34A TaxID=3445786 RepID=UPI003EEC1B10